MPGWKTWLEVGPETLQGSDINDYLMSQTAPRFINAAARDAAITAPDEYQLAASDDLGLQVYQSTSIGTPQWVRLWTPWSSFTSPTWSSGVTAGDGTWNTRRRFEAGSLHIRAQFQLGSTSAVTGPPRFDLSGSVLSSAATGISQGFASLRDTSAAQWYSATAIVGIGAQDVLIQATGGTNISSSAPFTWAAGDLIVFDLVVTGPGTDAT